MKLENPKNRISCEHILEALRPSMEALAPEPSEGWLPCIYNALCNGLFPDGEYIHPGTQVQQAVDLYVEGLEQALEAEREGFDPLTDLLPVDPSLCGSSRVREEYPLFRAALEQSHFLAMLYLGRELMPFDAASHTIGVRNVAVHGALLARRAGLPVDVPLVEAAALCHDIGKFACRGEDAKRIPYLHYYYTFQWLSERGMEKIAHVSANHSTWDLEFENLPIESLLLIYADFRVRGTRENGREVVRIYSLAQAYEMIMSKLSDVTPAKLRRYRLVYSKLRDFERFLLSKGIRPEFDVHALVDAEETDAALLSQGQAVDAIRELTFDNNVKLMHMISTDASFDLLLEQARGEKTDQKIRTYLRLFDEYNTYMTRSNKQKLLAFLYELLMHPEGDVRRIAGSIMGKILANSGPKYRKELPTAAPSTAMAPTMLALLEESVALWDSYVEQCLHPDHKIAQKHAFRIMNSLKTICETLFEACEEALAPKLAQVLFAHLSELQQMECFVLLDALCRVPTEAVTEEMVAMTEPRILQMLDSAVPRWKIVALRCVHHFRPKYRGAFLAQILEPREEDEPTVRYLRSGYHREDWDVALLYLSNLKNAVHWTVKQVQIHMLCRDLEQHPENAFHTAMHLSNLLSVSEHLPVRTYAGERLLDICKVLRDDQRNEIAVDLMRELETGQEQVARFIPQYLGRLLCTLPEKELWEAIYSAEELLRSGAKRPAGPILHTLGCVIAHVGESRKSVIRYCLGLLMVGIAHYYDSTHQTALTVLCHEVLGNEELSMELRGYCFSRVSKKLLSLLREPSEGQLTFFNRAAMLNHVYRFMVRYELDVGSFVFSEEKPVAFFPGTFDPFSVGHKRIVEELRKRDFEVYMAVDEFSWSKRTLPKLLRRKILQMSTAEQWDAYVFPDDLPINIAISEDLEKLRSCYPGRKVYLVAGSDVIHNASAYEKGSTASFPHIVVLRPESANLPPVSRILKGEWVEFSLPEQVEGISSTRIRDYIDKNLDVSALVDPIVQSYIYEYGLYLRTPMNKQLLTPEEYIFRSLTLDGGAMEVRLLTRREEQIYGRAVGHSVSIAELYGELKNVEACSAVRRLASGKLLMVDAVEGQRPQELLNELLVRSLPQEHSYALCRHSETLAPILEQLGFLPVEGVEGLYYVDMRAPMILIQDLRLCIKQPHRSSYEVEQAVEQTRPRLRKALTRLYPGKLLVSFDAEMLNQALLFKVQQLNPTEGKLGPKMCVPYGKILSDEIVPKTVTKTLHVEKSFEPRGESFSIVEYPGYSSLTNQMRTIKAFRRPVILVDDLLHKGYRIEKLNPLFVQEKLDIDHVVVAICSGRGRDVLRAQGRQVEWEYFIPNLHYWVTESLLYPFVGGDSVEGRLPEGRMLPSMNLILPYFYPKYFKNASEQAVRSLCRTALENALQILRALERTHQRSFHTALTLRKLGEALRHPRLPDRGRNMTYQFSAQASSYLEDDLLLFDRLSTGGNENGI